MEPTDTTGPTDTRKTPCEGCGKAWDPLVGGIADANALGLRTLSEIQKLTALLLFALVLAGAAYVWKGRA